MIIYNLLKNLDITECQSFRITELSWEFCISLYFDDAITNKDNRKQTNVTNVRQVSTSATHGSAMLLLQVTLKKSIGPFSLDE